jgi:hypothetical protein
MIKLSLNKEPSTEPIKTPERVEFSALSPRRNYVAPIVSGVIGLLIGFYLAGFLDQDREPIEPDRNEQVEPDKNEPEKQTDANKVEAAGSVFVFVYEFQTKTADQELLVRDLRAWSQIHKCEFRQFDRDSKDAEPYKTAAEKAGLQSPFLAVVRDKKIVRVFDWPRDRTALERLIK